MRSTQVVTSVREGSILSRNLKKYFQRSSLAGWRFRIFLLINSISSGWREKHISLTHWEICSSLFEFTKLAHSYASILRNSRIFLSRGQGKIYSPREFCLKARALSIIRGRKTRPFILSLGLLGNVSLRFMGGGSVWSVGLYTGFDNN